MDLKKFDRSLDRRVTRLVKKVIECSCYRDRLPDMVNYQMKIQGWVREKMTEAERDGYRDGVKDGKGAVYDERKMTGKWKFEVSYPPSSPSSGQPEGGAA